MEEEWNSVTVAFAAVVTAVGFRTAMFEGD